MQVRALDPTIGTWLDRISSARDPRSGNPHTERVTAQLLNDALFTEFGTPAPSNVEHRRHQVTTPSGTLRVDEYRPPGEPTALPALLSFHGGSFRLGALDELINVALCAMRAHDAHLTVLSIDYRLAPQHPHPAAADDAMAALQWTFAQAATLGIDPERIVVGGTSAGGSVAGGLALTARDDGLPLRGVLLEVPVTDLRDDAPWLDQFASLNGFTTIAELRGEYCHHDEATDPRVSPLLGDLSDLPPVHVMTAELDPLRESGEELVRRLAEAGNRVTATRHLGHLHGTQSLLRGFRGARLWHAEVVAVLRDLTRP